MAKMTKAKLKKLQRQVDEKLKNLVIPEGEDRKEFIARTLGPDYIRLTGATVYLVGQHYGGGGYRVGFVGDDGNNYESNWPQWAYDLAQAALLSGKPLLLLFASPLLPPTGDTLIVCNITNQLF